MPFAIDVVNKVVVCSKKEIPSVFKLILWKSPVAEWFNQTVAVEKASFYRGIPMFPIGRVWLALWGPRPVISSSEAHMLECGRM